jgi:thiol-disulfide isomerase/thioredoxin
MLNIGAWPLSVVAFLISLAVSAGAGALVARRSSAHAKPKMLPLIIDMALVGLLAARIGFVIEWLPQYLEAPWSILRIDDGGFSVLPGILAVAAFAIWRANRTPAIRRPLGAAMLAGWVAWVLLSGSLFLIRRPAPSLPTTELVRLDGSPVSLAALGGEPMIVNLWATWCPPCRREMPLLADAQRQRPDLTFVFVNQAEGRAEIRRYLRTEHLRLKNVLLDAFATTGRELGSQALPTTLFFDAGGTLVDTHVGAFSKASLAARLQGFGHTASGAGNSIPEEIPNGKN